MKKTLRYTVFALAVLALVFSAMSCAKRAVEALSEAAESAAQVIEAEPKPGEGMYFRLVTHGGDDPFWAVVSQGMRDAADELGCRAEIDLAGGDLANQQKAFQDAVASRPDGIALVVNDATAWDKPVQDALRCGAAHCGEQST